ncbi:hypothetical protein [Gottfriedia sp. OAE603]|uniref:hypothetical protein n=1 Tax=Gottfriedia sp. OAE603 TaxID=2663872 RepID=UPI00366FA8E5
MDQHYLYRNGHAPAYYYDRNEQRFVPFFPLLPLLGGLAGGFALGALAFRPPYYPCSPYGGCPPYGQFPSYGGGFPPYGGGFPQYQQPYPPPINSNAYLPGNTPGNIGYPY